MDFKDALKKAQNICSRREKCKYDIEQKLKEWGVSEDNMEKIIESLVKEKFIDEKRYVSSFVNDKFKFNKWGKIKIKYQLRLKGISEIQIDQALEQIPENKYKELLKDLLQKKSKSIKNHNKQEKYQKLVSFAYNRGFSFEDSKDLVNEMINLKP